ncbi:Tetratricopeptide repeat domain containing protein [Colletotrichum higginsianum IMI 349063]|uniref:Tetratricopeptide repeat domain containing protein n=2 Tax=Colletotrichum higginsianum (strain IMI 349063) TaxID=759273 RepID=A0A1B7YV14_COLHI|nr:Tetratricopeptide repeat domain containing protein [Colletotrichum higginsianum IMI 349063]OBR15891.1 Tetratricopeptide repeat domain containing protein [Colletotrichum higginsianum IMI 349063]
MYSVVYEPLSGSETNAYSYGTRIDRPYEGEKPPSAEVSQPAMYVPTTNASNVPNHFPVTEPVMSTYVPHYQPLQDSSNHAMTPQNSGHDTIVYPTDVPAAVYYPETSGVPIDDAISFPNLNASDRHLSAGEGLSDPYGDNLMDMAVSSALHQPSSIPARTAGFAMPPAYAMSCVKTEEVDMSAHCNSLDVVFPHQRPPASKRGPFKDQKAREETAATRKNGSCIRCKMQRVRCKTDPEDPKGPCVGCKPKSSNNHQKQLFRQPCVRRKITECNFFKRGQAPGYEWTRRWGNGIVDNINNWASSEVKTIRLWEGYTPVDMCVQLHVREFIPQPGDKLDRTWVAKGVKKSVAIPTYAITNLDEAQAAYEDYIKRGVVGCFKSVIESVMGVRMGVRDQLIYTTYLKAWELSQDTNTPPDERDLLLQTLELWMAVRLTTKSIEIVGDETLGMSRDILDSSSPQHGCIPLPPVMGAQLDLVLIQHIQTRLRREMLEKLQKMTLQNKQKTWLTTYLVTFMLLHNIALVTDHDASYAQKHGMGKKFARESDVQEYHLGGTILLAYFHYCNKGIYPFSEECKDQDLRTLAQLDEDAVQFIHWTRSQAMAHSLLDVQGGGSDGLPPGRQWRTTEQPSSGTDG